MPVGKLRSGKVGGASGIQPEVLKIACCEDGFMVKLMELCREVCSMLCDWCDAILVSIPKISVIATIGKEYFCLMWGR